MDTRPEYWLKTYKELIMICKKYMIHRWSGKRKKDIIAMIIAYEAAQAAALKPEPPAPQEQEQEQEQEPYEQLDALLMEHANYVVHSQMYADLVSETDPVDEFILSTS